MPEAGRIHLVGVFVAILVAAAVFAGVVFAVRADGGLGYEPPAAHSTSGANVSLSVFPDSNPCHGSASGAPGGGPHSEWVTYCPSTSIRVPAHSTITVTIKQYDTSTAFHNPFFDKVEGTIGGTMTFNGKSVTHVGPAAAAHTFTIQTPPNAKQHQLFVNVPLPGVPASAPATVTINGSKYPKPNVIVFRFRTGGPGLYVWHCYIPCGTGLAGEGIGGQEGFGGPMGTTGYMAGTVTVT